MWHDIETDDDYLNFKMMVDSVYDTIVEQYDDAPLSFGVSGNWGSGKSSFILQLRDKFADNPDYVICDFNAWLYQGFEDSKVAILTAVSNELAKLDENKTKEWKGKISPVISKIKKGKKLANAVISIIPGLPVVLNKINEVGDQVLDISESLFCDDQNDNDITVSIENFRKEIETKLTDSKKKLIVFIDDLDRCLPDVALETLEAMRLLLFVKRTVFVIAADKRMIENAVAFRFKIDGGSSYSGITKSYFDKLIQTPINLPVIGQTEALVYLLSLLAEYYYRSKPNIKDVSKCVQKLGMAELLENSWKTPVTKERIEECLNANDKDFVAECLSNGAVIDSLACVVPMLINTEAVSGNPRLLKRFIHTHILAVKIAKQRSITIKQDIHLMLLAIERSNMKLYEQLNACCVTSADGIIDQTVIDSKNLTPEEKHMVDSLKEDLRPYFYISRVAASQLISEIDDTVVKIFDVIVRVANPSISETEKREINKLSDSQRELLASLLIKKASGDGFFNLYISHLLYIDELIHSDTILNYFQNIPEDRMNRADKMLFWMGKCKDNSRYDILREKFPRKN